MRKNNCYCHISILKLLGLKNMLKDFPKEVEQRICEVWKVEKLEDLFEEDFDDVCMCIEDLDKSKY